MTTTRACFFTSISSNYLSKAIAWARSVRAVYSDSAIYIFCFNYRCLPSADLDSFQQLLESHIGGPVYLADPLPLLGDSSRPTFRFNITEGCTAVKPSVAISLLSAYSNVTYMDPDTILFGEFDDSSLSLYDFEVVPHVLTPDEASCRISPRLFLQSGVFNLGYFHATRASHSMRFLHWWRDFLAAYCYDFVSQGLYVDQKPCDLAPCFIDKLRIVRHPGYNVAWWNLLSDRNLLSDHTDFQLQFDGKIYPLIFFHFSNFPDLRLDRPPISRMTPKLFPGLEPNFCLSGFPSVWDIYRQYSVEVQKATSLISSFPVYNQYQTFYTNRPVWGFARSLYREAYPVGTEWDPFASGNRAIILKSLLVIILSLRFASFYRSVRFSMKSFLSLLFPSVNSYKPVPSLSVECPDA